MADETAPTTGTGETDSQSTDHSKGSFEAITSQEDFDKAIQARIARERAKFSDYDELKAKAAKFDQGENDKKTEDEKNAERLANLEKDLASERIGRLRAEVAAAKNVPVELLSGGTRDELEAAADALIQFKGNPTQRLVVPGEGKQPAQKKTTADLFAEAVGDAI